MRQITTDSGQIAADRNSQPTINPNMPQNETEVKRPEYLPGRLIGAAIPIRLYIWGPSDLQSDALPTELSRLRAFEKDAT